MLLFAGEELAGRLERERTKALTILERAAGQKGVDFGSLRRRCLLRVPRLYDEAEECTVERVDGGQRYMVRFEVPYAGEPDCMFLSDGSPYDEDAIEVSGRVVVLSFRIPAAGADREVAEVSRKVIERHDRLLAQVDARLVSQAASIVRVNAEIEAALGRAEVARERNERLRRGIDAALEAVRGGAGDEPGGERGIPEPSMSYG